MAHVALRSMMIELSMYPMVWQQGVPHFVEYPCALPDQDEVLAKEASEGLKVPTWEHPGDFRVARRNEVQVVGSDGRMCCMAVAFCDGGAASKLGTGGYVCFDSEG